MNIDIRLKLDVFEHPKIRKLQRRLGPEAVLALLRLWLWAAANRSDGNLRGLDADDVELVAQWGGPEGELVRALCEFRLLKLFEHHAAPLYVIHGWEEHQAWACRSDERSRIARRAAQARWDDKDNAPPAKAPPLKKEGKRKEEAASSPAKAAPKAVAPAPAKAAPKAKAVPQAAKAAPAASPSVPAAPVPAPVSASASLVEAAKAPQKKVEFQKDTGAACSNMLDAFSSNAPKANNQKPVLPSSTADAEATLCRGRGQGGSGGPSVPRQQTEGRRAFVPPTLQEVEMYCALRGNGINAQRFVAYYEARGWRAGPAPMRDWQATVRVWERRDRERGFLPPEPAASSAPALRSSPRASPPAPSPLAALMAGAVEAAPAADLWELLPPSPPRARQPLSGGLSAARPATVHQALARERDLIARMILNDNRGLYAQPAGHASPRGAAQSALPPEWTQCR